KQLGPDHPHTLASVNSLGILLSDKGDYEGALELLRRRATLSPEAEDAVGYNLACYECLAGNLDEAKRVITKHLEAHPEKKESALKDEDFSAIRDWIRKL
ncbi:hypothetical protein N9Z85_06175, partial [Akkermansiaceae bacterium]|nr:hypothetical protein [Akkermansiaceae bacterium]